MKIFEALETILAAVDLKRQWVTFIVSLLIVYWFVSFPLFPG